VLGKSNKKATIRFSHESDSFSGSSTSVPLNEGKLLDYLKNKVDHHGELVIRNVSEDYEIQMTTTRTLEHRKAENRIDEINDLIRNYIKGQAIPMEAHAVFADGVLKGIFGNETHARLKEKNLISKGISKEKIKVKAIMVDSFEDFE
jgi:hypothetical protein